MARILIVDDDEQICVLVSRLLEIDGHAVATAMTGVDALAELRARDFDLMLLDLVMPQKGGVETIMEIRTISPSLPIIVMSGRIVFGDASTTRLLGQYGVRAMLSKPFSAEELRSAVNLSLPA